VKESQTSRYAARIALLCGVLVAIVISLACSTETKQRFKVVDGATGEPITDFSAGVKRGIPTYRSYWETTYQTETHGTSDFGPPLEFEEHETDDGVFSISVPSDEKHTIFIKVEPSTFGKFIVDPADQDGTQPRVLEVATDHVISGKVVSEDGTSRLGASLYLGQLNPDTGKWREASSLAKTDRKGRFEIKGVSGPHEVLSAFHSSYGIAGASLGENPELSEHTLTLCGFGHVTGQISVGNTPVNDAFFILSGLADDGATYYAAGGELDEEGRYEFTNVPAGNAELVCNTKAGQNPFAKHRTHRTIVIPSDSTMVEDITFSSPEISPALLTKADSFHIRGLWKGS